MWTLANHTPFAADRAWARDGEGREVWIVAVKGTFIIAADRSIRLAKTQIPVSRLPKYAGAPGKSSLLCDSDLVLGKPRTDVLVIGCAYAPNGEPVRSVDVSLSVGPISKTLRVFGDRRWMGSAIPILTRPDAFDRMPIVYERAFGGTDERAPSEHRRRYDDRNPIGVGYATSEITIADMPAPNIEDPRALISSWNERPAPAGFCAVPGHWLPRRNYAGTYDDGWKKTRFPMLPTDFDPLFYCCAPSDQQVADYLRGGETVEVRNMTPGGVFGFTLPRVLLGFETMFAGAPSVTHRATLSTVIIEPDHSRLQMVWTTLLPCHANVLKLQHTVIIQKPFIRGSEATNVQMDSLEDA
jgi:hypothetical protein